jgi:tetratricopeptide (TPR) repeat protein
MTAATLGVLLSLLAQAPQPPPAVVKAPRDPLLRRGAALFDTLDFENAKAAYERALQVRLASVDEVVEAYLGVGLCDATLGDLDGAKKAFLQALAVKPDAQLEGADISPRQRAPFDTARAEAASKGVMRIDHVPPAAALPGAPIKLKVEVVNDWAALVAGVRLSFRREGQGRYDEVTHMGPSPYELSLPPAGAGILEYHLQAIDARGNPVAQWRSPEEPNKLNISEVSAVAEGPPLYKRPVLWIIIGSVVVAGAAASITAVALQPPNYQVTTRP